MRRIKNLYTNFWETKKIKYWIMTLIFSAGALISYAILNMVNIVSKRSFLYLELTITKNTVLYILLAIILFFLGSMIGGYFYPKKRFSYLNKYGVMLVTIGLGLIICDLFFYQKLIYYIFFILGIQNCLFTSQNGIFIRTTQFTSYITDMGFAIGSAIKGNRKELWKVGFYTSSICWFIIGSIVEFVVYMNLNKRPYFIGALYIVTGIAYFFMRRSYEKNRLKESIL